MMKSAYQSKDVDNIDDLKTFRRETLVSYVKQKALRQWLKKKITKRNEKKKKKQKR